MKTLPFNSFCEVPRGICKNWNSLYPSLGSQGGSGEERQGLGWQGMGWEGRVGKATIYKAAGKPSMRVSSRRTRWDAVAGRGQKCVKWVHRTVLKTGFGWPPALFRLPIRLPRPLLVLSRSLDGSLVVSV